MLALMLLTRDQVDDLTSTKIKNSPTVRGRWIWAPGDRLCHIKIARDREEDRVDRLWRSMADRRWTASEVGDADRRHKVITTREEGPRRLWIKDTVIQTTDTSSPCRLGVADSGLRQEV